MLKKLILSIHDVIILTVLAPVAHLDNDPSFLLPGSGRHESEENKGTGHLGDVNRDRPKEHETKALQFPHSYEMRLVSRYIRWSRSGHANIARNLSDFIDKNPEATKILGEAEANEKQNIDFVEKLQFCKLNSDLSLHTCEYLELLTLCVVLSAR